MDQFMNRAAGMEALYEASEALTRARSALHERVEGRENLFGPTSELIGGLGQAVSALRDQLEDGLSPATIANLDDEPAGYYSDARNHPVPEGL